jgi:hypothetical protein
MKTSAQEPEEVPSGFKEFKDGAIVLDCDHACSYTDQKGIS